MVLNKLIRSFFDKGFTNLTIHSLFRVNLIASTVFLSIFPTLLTSSNLTDIFMIYRHFKRIYMYIQILIDISFLCFSFECCTVSAYEHQRYNHHHHHYHGSLTNGTTDRLGTKQGQETPIYIWYENYPTHSGEGYEGRVSRVSSESPFGAASLNLTDIRESDQGWYECKVVFLNRAPNQHKNGSWFHLDVHAPPRFSVTPEDIVYVNLGEFSFIIYVSIFIRINKICRKMWRFCGLASSVFATQSNSYSCTMVKLPFRLVPDEFYHCLTHMAKLYRAPQNIHTRARLS